MGEIMTKLTCEDVLNEPTASYWLKDAVRSALKRDIVDASNEAEFLSQLLRERCLKALNLHE